MLTNWLGIFATLIFITLSGAAQAAPDGSPAPLRLTMDQTQIVHLQQDASNVIINTPDHVSVTLENPRLLILTPHLPGTTSMIVLDNAGKTILQQDLIVTNLKSKYVRIKRICASSDSSCNAASYAYCPDGCYEVTAVPATAAGSPPPPSGPPGTIAGEPAQTLLGPADDCPEGFNKVFVPGITSGDQHYTCEKR